MTKKLKIGLLVGTAVVVLGIGGAVAGIVLSGGGDDNELPTIGESNNVVAAFKTGNRDTAVASIKLNKAVCVPSVDTKEIAIAALATYGLTTYKVIGISTKVTDKLTDATTLDYFC